MTTAQAEARTLIELIAGPLRLGDNVKSALARVASTTGLGNRRIRGIWNGEARRIEAEEMDCLRQVALDARTRKEAEHAYRAHIARLHAARASVRLLDQNEDRDVANDGLRMARAEDRPLDRGAI